MLKIRTITYNLPKKFGSLERDRINSAFRLWNEFEYEVHTQRINLPIMERYNGALIDEVAKFCSDTGIRWFGIPVDLEFDDWGHINIAEILSTYKNAFCNMICSQNGKISDRIIRAVSRQFLMNAEADSDGLIGFRFGASNNVAPNGPFFPFTYSDGEHLGFSIGLELAEEINNLCKIEYTSITEFRDAIVENLEFQFTEIERRAFDISEMTGMSFDGIDFSLAPLPGENNSVMTILEKVGISNINDTGMLFATAFFTKLLKSFAAEHKSVGFAGVMYSLLEDTEYAEMNRRNEFSMNNMIALSTMCGCGVDMVPISMETTEETIRTILLEVACVSSRLHKPLGVRLLPVPDEGDHYTHFKEEKDFVVNTRIVNVQANKIGTIDGEYVY